MAQATQSNGHATNGHGGTPVLVKAAKRENRGRGLLPEVEDQIVAALGADEMGTSIAKRLKVSSSTVYAVHQRKAKEIKSLKAHKKARRREPAPRPIKPPPPPRQVQQNPTPAGNVTPLIMRGLKHAYDTGYEAVRQEPREFTIAENLWNAHYLQMLKA